MRLYFIVDKVSGNIISTRTAENLDVFKRYLISNRIDLTNQNNYSSLRLLNDCVVYEALITSIDEDFLYFDEICKANKVLVIKDFFDQFDKKSGSLEDKV